MASALALDKFGGKNERPSDLAAHCRQDDTRMWWDELPGPKHFLMLPNADHPLEWHNLLGMGNG